MCILSKTDHLLSVQRTKTYLPSISDQSFRPTAEDYAKLRDDFSDLFDIPENFTITAPVYQPNNPQAIPIDVEQLRKTNPQTELLCLMLGLRNPIDVILNRRVEPIRNDSMESAKDS